MKRKLLAVLLVLALVCTLVFSLVACDPTGNSGDSGDSGNVGDNGGNNGGGNNSNVDETFDPASKNPSIDVPGLGDSDASGANDGDEYIHN